MTSLLFCSRLFRDGVKIAWTSRPKSDPLESFLMVKRVAISLRFQSGFATHLTNALYKSVFAPTLTAIFSIASRGVKGENPFLYT